MKIFWITKDAATGEVNSVFPLNKLGLKEENQETKTTNA